VAISDWPWELRRFFLFNHSFLGLKALIRSGVILVPLPNQTNGFLLFPGATTSNGFLYFFLSGHQIFVLFITNGFTQRRSIVFSFFWESYI